MAPNSTPRQRRKKKVLFSTGNIATSQSQGLGEGSLSSPSQLVLGYAAGKLVRTPPANVSSKTEDRDFPESPTPRPRLSSLVQPRATVNHPSRALGDKSSLSPFANPPPPPFATDQQPPRDPSKTDTMAASPPGDDWEAYGANLLRAAPELLASSGNFNQPAATAAQPASASNSNEVGPNKFLDITENQDPATTNREPLPSNNSEFPTNTGADKQQWRAAVQANVTSSPLNLNIPDRAHRRSSSGQESWPSNSHLGDTTMTNSAEAYGQMLDTVQKARAGNQRGSTVPSNANNGATTDTRRNPFSVPYMAADAPNLNAHFAAMMATLEQPRPADLTLSTNTVAQQFTQPSSMGTGIGQNIGDMSRSGFQMGSDFQRSMQSMNQSAAQGNMMSTGSQIGRSSSVVQVGTPDLSSGYSMPSMDIPPNLTNTMNVVNQTGESSSAGQGNMTDPFGSGSPNLTHMSRSIGQGNTANNGGYGSGYSNSAQDNNSLAAESFELTPWEALFAYGFSAPKDSMAGMAQTSSSTQANPGANMAGPSTQVPSTDGGGFAPLVTSTYMGNNHGNLRSVPGGYNMSFVPSSPNQMMNNSFASALGLNAQISQTTPQALSSANLAARSLIGSTRSATPINLVRAASPAVRSTRSNSSALAVPDTSTVAVSPNPLHPAGFYRDTPRASDTPLIAMSPNPLHPASFHAPTPRAQWPTSHRPIPPNPAVSGNTPGYFQPGHMGNMNMQMNMQSPTAFQPGQLQYDMNAGGQQSMEMHQQLPNFIQPMSWDEMLAQAQADVDEEYGELPDLAPDPRRSSPENPYQTLMLQRIDSFEQYQPLTVKASEELRRLQLALSIHTSLRTHSLDGPMPFDGKPLPPMEHLAMDPRKNKTEKVIDGPLALKMLTVGENFECDFCSGKPNPYGIGPYNHDFVDIVGPAGHDWCRECVATGKNMDPPAVPEEMDVGSSQSRKDYAGKGKGKRTAKDSAGPGPSPKKPTHSSSFSSSMNAAGSSTPAEYDRYAPMSDESNVFGDPQEIRSSIDNILINPFMNNLMCRGHSYRQLDLTKTKICLTCKVKKMKIIAHGCHTEFTHIVALNSDNVWQYGYNTGVPGPSQVDGSADMDADINPHGFSFDVNADLNDGRMTLEDINSAVQESLKAGGMNADGMNSSMDANMDFTVFDGVQFDWDLSSSPPAAHPPSTPPPPNPAHAHTHQVHMNGRPHGTISKLCMVCPANADFLCDGCPLTLCERCRYRLRNVGKGWFNNLIYANGVNHNRNDAFLLRSDNGGYHEYGKYWPLPAHVNRFEDF